MPVRTENPQPPAQNSRLPAQKIRGTRAEDLRHFTQLSTGACAEQPWNSLEKFKFSVSCSVRGYIHVVAVKMPSTVEVCAE